jgi:hypothetical protein
VKGSTNIHAKRRPIQISTTFFLLNHQILLRPRPCYFQDDKPKSHFYLDEDKKNARNLDDKESIMN